MRASRLSVSISADASKSSSSSAIPRYRQALASPSRENVIQATPSAPPTVTRIERGSRNPVTAASTAASVEVAKATPAGPERKRIRRPEAERIRGHEQVRCQADSRAAAECSAAQGGRNRRGVERFCPALGAVYSVVPPPSGDANS